VPHEDENLSGEDASLVHRRQTASADAALQELGKPRHAHVSSFVKILALVGVGVCLGMVSLVLRTEEAHRPSTHYLKIDGAFKAVLESFPTRAQCSVNREPISSDSDPHDVKLSLDESSGYLAEPTHAWRLRKKKHIGQMCKQGAHLDDWCGKTTYSDAEYDKGLCYCLGECPGHKFWQSEYEPSFSCTFEERVGFVGDGGKWVCDPYRLSLKAKEEGCLVYSIGSSARYDFEQSVFNQISPLCEIHTVDRENWTFYNRNAPPPKYVNYHVHTIGNEPATPIPTLVDMLGHRGREIDIFKIDCERCEWDTYSAWFDAGVQFRQILVEMHGTGPRAGRKEPHKFFKHLFDLGYVIFHKEPNTVGCRGGCLEYAFLKLTPAFSRAWAP